MIGDRSSLFDGVDGWVEPRVVASCFTGFPCGVPKEEGVENERKLGGCPNVGDARYPTEGWNSRGSSGLPL